MKTCFCIFADRWRRFVRIFVVFCQFYKLHPIFLVYLAFKAQLENTRGAKIIQGRILKFCRDAGEEDQAFVERVLEGTPSPKSHAPIPRGMRLR